MPPSPLIEFKNISQEIRLVLCEPGHFAQNSRGRDSRNSRGKRGRENNLDECALRAAAARFGLDIPEGQSRFRCASPGKPSGPVSEWSTRISCFSLSFRCSKTSSSAAKGKPDAGAGKRRPEIIPVLPQSSEPAGQGRKPAESRIHLVSISIWTGRPKSFPLPRGSR